MVYDNWECHIYKVDNSYQLPPKLQALKDITTRRLINIIFFLAQLHILFEIKYKSVPGIPHVYLYVNSWS